MDQRFAQELAKAAAADLAENPSVLFAISNLVDKGKRSSIDDLVALDIKRGMTGKGPVYFPHVRGAVRRFMEQAKLKSKFGMGQTTTTTAQPSAGTIIATSIIGAIATVGATYYASKLQLDAQKDQFKMQQRLEAQRAEREAAQIEAQLALQQAQAAQAAPVQAGLIPGLPSWAPIVGIGAAVLIGVVMYMKS